MNEAGPTVLLVDDDTEFTQDIVTLLSNNGFIVVPCDTGAMARNLLEEVTPDLILCSLTLPDVDARQLLRTLRTQPVSANLPMVAISTEDDPQIAARLMDEGVDGYVTRPVAGAALIATVRGLIRAAEERAHLSWLVAENTAMVEIQSILDKTHDEQEALAKVSSAIAALVPASSCSIILLDKDHKTGHIATGVADFWEDDEIEETTIELKSFPELARAVEAGRPLVREDVAVEPLEITLSQDDDASEESYNRGFGLFPLIYNEDVHGLLIVHLPTLSATLTDRQQLFYMRAAQACAARVIDKLQFETFEESSSLMESSSVLSTGSFSVDEAVEEQKLLVNLVEHSADAIVAAAMDGTLMVFNRSAERLFGYHAEDIRGQLNAGNLYLPGAANETMRILRSKDLGEPGYVHNLQTEALSAEGEIIPISLSAAILYEGEREIATVGILKDLRQRLALESRLQEMSAQLVESEKQATLAALAGTTAHELNQPLTTIMGLVEMLQFQAEEDGKFEQQLDRVYAETERMSAIVRRIGKITRFTTTRYVGDTEILDLDKASE